MELPPLEIPTPMGVAPGWPLALGAAEELSDDEIDEIIATNLVGSIQLIRAVLPHVRAQGGGASSSSPRLAGRSPTRAPLCTT
jgi:NAD(P)-dependent dehydrogenase (short-subunit alcohol dehydrogenase family)